jgi:serine/threonine protein kinase/tetratricopeptide (TPR) repeat protein
MGPPLDPIASLRLALRGHYDIEREIGQGAFATVYLARDLKHERKVAVKVLHADPTSETGELRFIREIRLLARLQHPNILPLHDSGHVEALLYYVMPYVGGETLRDRIHREKQLAVDVACSIAREVADALAYAHGQGIIHRDIKPENILLSAGHPILADFGIARVIDLAGVRQVTRTGAASPGTPAYMSPEQLMGDKELDGRSDTYSLGCVLFEMLTGKPPFNGKEGFVKRFTEPPPSPLTLRKGLPSWMDDVVMKALARSPNDRYQTAQELVRALTVGTSAVGEARSRERLGRAPTPESGSVVAHDAAFAREYENDVQAAHPAQSLVLQRGSAIPGVSRESWAERFRNRRKSVAIIAGGVLLVAIGMATSKIPSLRTAFFAASVDSTRVALVPFAGSAQQRDRDRISNGLYTALSEWRGLNLASDQDVADAARGDGPPTSTRAAAALARRVGAGRFIWGQVNSDDPSQARAQLYDVSSNVPLASTRIQETVDRAGFANVAQELLKRPDRPAAADGGDGRTKSYSAWNAYGLGHAAFLNGDFQNAGKHFRNAVTADPGFGPARVWLAQTLSLGPPDSRGDWREQIAQALGAKSGLAERERLIGLALSRMGDRRYPEACASYAELIRADSLNFVGFFGLGQCRAYDSLVVRSASSPSRWRFRSQYSDAATGYMRALSLNPNAHSILSFDQLQELLPMVSTKTRRGRNSAGEAFAAYPALINDTVVFVPYPLIQFAGLSAKETMPAMSAAVARNLDVLLDFTTKWTRESPRSAPAYQALGEVMEARGELTRSRSGTLSAIQAIQKAREVATNRRDSLVATTSEAWLLFKQGQFTRARVLADTLLRTLQEVTPDQAAGAIGLAALTGKIGQTAELARLTSAYAAAVESLPIQVVDAAAPFFAFASLGVCGDTIADLERRLDDQLAHYVAEDQQARVTTAVKARPLSMLASCTGGQSSLRIKAPTSRLLRMQQAFATSDSAALRSLLVAVTNDGRTQRPGDVSLDFTYQIAWLRTASGDTAAAARQLDRALGSLPSLSAASVREPASAAAAGRSMALRAEIAAARGEVEERRKWAQAVVDLWATADAPLQPVVTRMRLLANPVYRQ